MGGFADFVLRFSGSGLWGVGKISGFRVIRSMGGGALGNMDKPQTQKPKWRSRTRPHGSDVEGGEVRNAKGVSWVQNLGFRVWESGFRI